VLYQYGSANGMVEPYLWSLGADTLATFPAVSAGTNCCCCVEEGALMMKLMATARQARHINQRLHLADSHPCWHSLRSSKAAKSDELWETLAVGRTASKDTIPVHPVSLLAVRPSLCLTRSSLPMTSRSVSSSRWLVVVRHCGRAAARGSVGRAGEAVGATRASRTHVGLAVHAARSPLTERQLQRACGTARVVMMTERASRCSRNALNVPAGPATRNTTSQADDEM
jgi:hypothetical protein